MDNTHRFIVWITASIDAMHRWGILAESWASRPECGPGALQETPASPSVKCTRGRHKNTRGSLPRVQHSGKSLRGCLSRERALPRVPKIVHSGKTTPSAVLALGEELTPSVLSAFGFWKSSSPSATLGEEFYFFKKTLPRVLHSGKKLFFKKIQNPLPEALGEKFFCFNKNLFPECHCPDTRGRH
jgi:hypothetical protein